MDNLKKDYEHNFAIFEKKLNIIKDYLQSIMSLSHRVVKTTTDSMNTMVVNLEKGSQGNLVVDLDLDWEKGNKEAFGPSKRIHANMK